MRREDSPSAQARQKEIEKEIANLKEQLSGLKQQWEQEKQLIETVKQKKNHLESLRFQEEEAERKADYEKVAELRYKVLPEVQKEIAEAEKRLHEKSNRLLQEEVDENLVAQIVAKWTGVPVQKIREGEADKLLHLEEELRKRVVGQELAVTAVSEAIRRSRSGLSDPHRPVGAFLFLGPTGVGKTELAKALAEQLFDQEEAIIRLDMSEYMEKHSVSKLIGAPPGYVGYEEGGQLTEALRRRQYAVVLLDEVEKAHPEVFNMLLQIFDEGRITDSKGRRVNCRNALFIMTSNLGSDKLLKELEHPKTDLSKEAILALLDPVIREHFRPEFINRLDELLPFLPLRKEEMGHIVEIQLHRLQARIRERHLFLSWDEEVVQLLGEEGYDPLFGARPLKRLVQQLVANKLAKAILDGTLKPNSNVRLIREEKGVGYRVT